MKTALALVLVGLALVTAVPAASAFTIPEPCTDGDCGPPGEPSDCSGLHFMGVGYEKCTYTTPGGPCRAVYVDAIVRAGIQNICT